MRLGLAMLASLGAILAGPAMAADALCAQIKAFDSAKFANDGSPDRRWVEVHWRGRWLDMTNGFGIECLHSPDTVSASLCKYLTDNTSFEFPERLPQRILACKGSSFAGIQDWHDWKSNIVFTGAKGIKASLLQVNLADLPEGVVRYSISSDFPAVEPLTVGPR